MKKVDVIIFIEHIVRELESAILISQELSSKGLSVVIKSTFYDYYEVLKNYECNILIIPWCYDNKDYRLYSNIKCNKIVNLHHEQIDNLTINKLLPKENAKKTYHISWGDTFTRELIEAGVEQNTIFQTGSVRCDFYANKFKEFSVSRSVLADRYGLNASKKWILIAGNFPQIYFLDQLHNKGKYKISKIAVETYYMILDWLNEICQELMDEYEIIYRPHPTESNSKGMNNVLINNPNIKFIREENIRDWIINSELVFAWRSTSAIDSLIAKKRTYLLRPIYIQDEFELPILKHMLKVDSINKFRDAIFDQTRDDIPRNELALQELRNRYDDNNGDSYKKLCARILEISSMKRTVEGLDEVDRFSFKDHAVYYLKNGIKKRIELYNKFGLFKEFENFAHERIKEKDLEKIQLRLDYLDL